MTLAPGAAGLAALYPWLDALLTPLALPSRMSFQVQVVLQEAVSNAALHGFAEGKSGTVRLEVAAGPDRVEAVLRDDGVAFDPTAAPAPRPAATLDELPLGGRGLMLMRRFCSDMRYRRDGASNELIMVFEPEAGSAASNGG